MKICFIAVKRNLMLFLFLPLVLVILMDFSSLYSHVIMPVAGLPDFSEDEILNSGKGGKLAIIIDDFGQSRNGVKEMMSINRYLTFAVMPFLEFSEEDALTAHEKGYEVIVHLSMEPYRGKLSWLGPRPIFSGMPGEEVVQIVEDSFISVPHAVGANNHMGSKASDDENVVSNILNVIKEKDMFFVDSMTSERHICKKIAALNGVRCYERDVFLDGQKPKSYVKEQLRKAEIIAVKKGKAVAIGHVGAEGGKVTAEAISEMLAEFDKNKIELTFISELK